MGSVDLPSSSGLSSGPIPTRDLVSFEDVFKLKCTTIHHIPAKARPIFAKVLSVALREVYRRGVVKFFYAAKVCPIAFSPKRSSPSEQFNYFIMQAVAKKRVSGALETCDQL